MSGETESICEITKDAITTILKKYPRKKSVFKDYCHEYKITGISEMLEWQGTEILEILDSTAYIMADRAKAAEKKRKKHEQLLSEFKLFLSNNNDRFIILDKGHDCYLLSKIINVIVQTKNINPVFQPYETIKENRYFICFIIKLSEDVQLTDLMHKFIVQNCKLIGIHDVEDIANTLNSIT